jgi:hypothetical protein
MSAPLLLASILGMALVIFWYIQDETTRGGQAKSGFLAMNDGEPKSDKDDGNGGKWKRAPANRPWRLHRR